MKKIAVLVSLILGVSFAAYAQEYGVASYYSDKFQGRPTANGETYDKDKLTASHKTLPFGTYIRVTRLDNKKSVVVRVNDRGPYISGRIVDLSKKAADLLDLSAEGTARVKVDVVQAASTEGEGATAAAAPGDSKPKEAAPAPVAEKPAEPAKKEVPAKTADKPKAAAPAAAVPDAGSVPTPYSGGGASVGEPKLVTGKDFQSYDLYKIDLYRPEKTGFAVQVASLSSHDSALRQVANLQGKFFKNVLLSIEKAPNGASLYKVLLGPFPTREAAETYRKSLKKQHKMDGFLVDISAISY
jgi:rare lipoprotein A